jgi:allantoinase
MKQARTLHLPVAVHAETQELIGSPGDGSAAAFLDSRPIGAELDAIAVALDLAGETGAALHIVHISCGRGVTLAAEARARGVDVSIETCPHYLTFTDEDIERLGVIAKCAPPLRPVADHTALWQTLMTGAIDMVGSDHSPAPPSMKVSDDFRLSWGGIAGIQSTLAVLLTGGAHERHLPLERIASLVATAPARRFRMARKGRIAPGYDADLALVDLASTDVLSAEALQQRHASSPYVGMMFRGVVRRTLRRGETIFHDGAITARTGGRFLRPA